MAKRFDLTAEQLRKLLHYEPETGAWRWNLRPSRHVKAGEIAGCLMNVKGQTYWQIKIRGFCYRAHVLAFLYMTGKWPVDIIDHHDMDGLNNRWSNLREADNSQNQANRTAPTNNTSGFKGVSLDRIRGTYRATMEAHGKSIFIGRFETAIEAHKAVALAHEKNFGEFARV